jgi:NhaA family Na+:H+ antiporter
VRRILSPLARFLATESAGGVVLLAAAAAALVWANASAASYEDVWGTHLRLGAWGHEIDEDLRHWVNEALMALFFFVVGLEIKRELVTGELRDRRTAALPALAALGGMVVPALVYLAWTAGSDAADGWGIPVATDIAFAVGVLVVLGPRAPAPLKLFLLTLAIVDDIGAIAVIAVFYTDTVEMGWLAGATAVVAAILVAQRWRVGSLAVYALAAVVLWVCTYRSGVHATIAGVALGLLTPARWPGGSPIERLEGRLHPVASFVAVPVFALANAGVAVGGDALTDALGGRVTWGVATGLVAGKLAGVSLATVAGVRTGAGRLPPGVTIRHVVGAAALAGIGFTVSLFVSELSFGGSPRLLGDAKIGVLLGSLTSGLLGAAILTGLPARSRRRR